MAAHTFNKEGKGDLPAAGEPSDLRGRGEAERDEQGVVLLREPDAVTGELAGQPFMTSEVDLELQGKPGLEEDVDQAELGVHEVVVDEEALAPGRLDVRGLVPAHGVGPTRLQGRKHADPTVRDAVA